jgi:hypothetical protein
MRFSGANTPHGSDDPDLASRLRKLPFAVLLMAGYYASQVPPLSDIIRRLG